MGLYHWDNCAPNEEWLLIEETAEVETVSIDYHKDLAKIDLSMPPKFSDASPWDNRQGAVPLTGSTTITSTVTDSQSITNSTSDTTGRKYTAVAELTRGQQRWCGHSALGEARITRLPGRIGATATYGLRNSNHPRCLRVRTIRSQLAHRNP